MDISHECVDHVQITPGLSLCTDGHGGFWYSGPQSLYIHLGTPLIVPYLYQINPRPVRPASRQKANALKDLEEAILKHSEPLIVDDDRGSSHLSNAALRDVGDFIHTWAPWALSFVGGPSWELMLSCTKDVYGNIDNRRVWPMILSQILCHQAVWRLCPTSVLDDGFYSVTNITTPVTIMQSRDMKQLCERMFGVYTKHLARAVTAALSDNHSIQEMLAVMSLLHGLPAEYIIDLLESRQWDTPASLQWRGIPSNDLHMAIIPTWLSTVSAARRARWSKNISLLAEVIRLSLEVDMSQVDYNTPDIYELHARIIAASPQDDESVYDEVEHFPPVSTRNLTISVDVGEVTEIKLVTTCAELHHIAVRMDICIDFPHHQEKLRTGTGVYAVGLNSKSFPIVASEWTPRGDKVEIRGERNHKMDLLQESQFTEAVRQHWFANSVDSM